MLSALPPVRLRRVYTEPSGATRLTTRSPTYVCTMGTSPVEVDDALPVQPEMVIGLLTVVLSGMVTSVPLVPPQVGGAEPPRFSVHESMVPVSADAASCTRSFQVPLAAS